jgi:diamine N-acetyltransferase
MIKGDHVILRALELSDVEVLYQWENNMTLWQVSNTLVPFSRHQLEKYVRSAALDLYQTRQLRLIIETTDQASPAQVVGLLDLFDFDPYHNRAGIGIVIHESWRRQGLAREALLLFLNYAFTTLGLHTIYCNVAASNDNSLHLFKSLGFSRIGVKKEWLRIKNGFDNEVMFQIISNEHQRKTKDGV